MSVTKSSARGCFLVRVTCSPVSQHQRMKTLTRQCRSTQLSKALPVRLALSPHSVSTWSVWKMKKSSRTSFKLSAISHAWRKSSKTDSFWKVASKRSSRSWRIDPWIQNLNKTNNNMKEKTNIVETWLLWYKPPGPLSSSRRPKVTLSLTDYSASRSSIYAYRPSKIAKTSNISKSNSVSPRQAKMNLQEQGSRYISTANVLGAKTSWTLSSLSSTASSYWWRCLTARWGKKRSSRKMESISCYRSRTSTLKTTSECSKSTSPCKRIASKVKRLWASSFHLISSRVYSGSAKVSRTSCTQD